MYKSKLSTASASSPQLRDEEPWTIGRVIENRQAVLPYSVEIEYPIFSSDNEDLSVLNAVLKGNAYQKLLSERESAYGSYEQDDEWWYGEGNAYASTFRIMLFCEDIISIKISMNSYSAGAVHGYHASEGISFFTKPLRRFDLADLFARPLESINTISDCCIKQLELESHSDESDDWVREGASPKWENFSSFTITERGIEIVFQPYQVSCFADGERIVLLTGRFLKPLLHEDSMFPKIWEER